MFNDDYITTFAVIQAVLKRARENIEASLVRPRIQRRLVLAAFAGIVIVMSFFPLAPVFL